jgi:hypothetical protein
MSTTTTDARQFCPSAKTLLGYDPVGHRHRLVPLRCKRWRCDFCRKKNVYHLQQRALKGKPQRFATLTTRCQYGETPQAAHDRCRPQIARLVTLARKRYGPIEYVAFLERTKAGWPHWHLLIRGAFIPQHWLSATWKALTGAFIVDIRRINNPKHAAAYVAKYVTKTAKEDPEQRLGRIVSFSRHYLPPKSPNPFSPWIWEILPAEHYSDVRQRLTQTMEETPFAAGWEYQYHPSTHVNTYRVNANAMPNPALWPPPTTPLTYLVRA